ncbi:MAG: hypothetical protein ABSC15_11715 [Terriglobales bacterium]
MRFATFVVSLAVIGSTLCHSQDARFVPPSNCYSPLLQAKLDFKGSDSYRLAYLSIINRESFESLKGSGFLKGLFLDPPAALESGWGFFHEAQMKEISKTSLNIDQERERSLSILGLDPQAGKIIHECLTGGLGLTYTYWSTNKSTTILQLNWRGQGAIPLHLTKSHLQNATSVSATRPGVLFDGPITIKESKTITLKRTDLNDDIIVTFDLDPEIKYEPPIIGPFPKRQQCEAKTYTRDPKYGFDYAFRVPFDVNQEKYLRRNVAAIYGTDWYFTYTVPPEGMKLFTDTGNVVVTEATCDKDHQEHIDIVGANKGPTAPASGINTPTVSCEGGKDGQAGEIWLSGRFTVTAEECKDIDW